MRVLPGVRYGELYERGGESTKDKRANLDQEWGCLVWTFGRPRSARPADHFACVKVSEDSEEWGGGVRTKCSDSEDELPPCAIHDRCEGMYKHAYGKQDAKRDAGSE